MKQIWNEQKEYEKDSIAKLDKLWKNESKLKEHRTELEGVVENLEKEKNSLQAEVKLLEEKVAVSNEELYDAREDQLRLAEKASVENERDKSVLDLLRMVTQARFEDNQASGLVEGVLTTSTSDIHPFSFDIKENSKQEICAKLWDQMDQGDKF